MVTVLLLGLNSRGKGFEDLPLKELLFPQPAQANQSPRIYRVSALRIVTSTYFAGPRNPLKGYPRPKRKGNQAEDHRRKKNREKARLSPDASEVVSDPNPVVKVSTETTGYFFSSSHSELFRSPRGGVFLLVLPGLFIYCTVSICSCQRKSPTYVTCSVTVAELRRNFMYSPQGLPGQQPCELQGAGRGCRKRSQKPAGGKIRHFLGLRHVLHRYRS